MTEICAKKASQQILCLRSRLLELQKNSLTKICAYGPYKNSLIEI